MGGAARGRRRRTSSRPSTAGLDTEIGERGVQLSAGQRQLVAFARALLADPRILILDEATSNVDLHTEGKIEAGLRRLLAGRTAIVIAHRLSTIRQAGRIVVLEHGRIVEQGTHDELIAARGRVLAPVPRLGRARRGLELRPAPERPMTRMRDGRYPWLSGPFRARLMARQRPLEA